MRSVLVSGAGIAGLVFAYWARRHGLEPVVVERAPGLRAEGHGVDLRGAGREVVRRMGLEDAVRAAGTGEQGIAFTDWTGRTRARVGREVFAGFGGEGPTAELEVLRGQLATLIRDAAGPGVEWVFDDHIAAIDDRGSGPVRVRLAGGGSYEVDVVVAADGIGSATRRLVFGEHDEQGRAWFRPVGVSLAYLTVPRRRGDGSWATWQHDPGGRSVILRPDPVGTTRAALSFLAPPCLRGRDPDAQKALLTGRFIDVGGAAPRVLDALAAASEFYAEDVGQVRMPAWSRGRVVLLGDAGYCPSPISGMGTTLAVVGAAVLAGELARCPDPAAAFAAYEERMRPYVDRAQELPPGTPYTGLPRTRWGIRVLHAALRATATPPLTGMMGRFLSPPAHTIDLPSHLTTAAHG
ncbi:FAD-dependent monooxygenase [Pseudonocardia sp. S2-4]|uniref:FAD-dependent monooxygenase n=1 Tax=Pseudonocardia humida TaxID=2800819 RepID=A0ABT1A0I9_9PSEU|nr:FAD-dependent monooxygenase [Pseudonocardia humida]